MTEVQNQEPDRSSGAAGSGTPRPAAKSGPTDLEGRAPRPPVVRLRRSAIQVVVAGGCILVAGSLAWAFVVQPELRASARSRAGEARESEAHGAVRPAEQVTDQPASYDRLPEPRTRDAEAAPGEEKAERGTPLPQARRPYPAPAASIGPAPAGPNQLAVRSSLFFEGAPPPQPTRAVAADRTETFAAPPSALDPGGPAGARGVYNRHELTAPVSPYELKAGAIVPAVLLTGVDTSRPGPVVAAVTQNIYDTVTGRHLLIPQGTRLLGTHEGDSAYGDRRAFLAWERLILPNGKSLVLEAEPGVDAQGATGVRGRVDRRIGALITGTLFAGAITTLGQIAREGGDSGRSLLGDAGDAAAIEGARVGGRLIDRELEVRPAIRVSAGGRVRVLITRDLILEPYQP